MESTGIFLHSPVAGIYARKILRGLKATQDDTLQVIGRGAIDYCGRRPGSHPALGLPLAHKGGHGNPALAAALLLIGNLRGFFKNADEHVPGQLSGLGVLVRGVVRGK
jgi:hypothetical protein